ncbi:MAG: hypothetical protein ABI864_05975 [Chloroflexota bacterium]
MVWLILIVVAAGLAATRWLGLQVGIWGFLLGLLLIPISLVVVIAVGQSLDRRRGRTVGDASVHFDPNKPNLVNYNDAGGLGDWPTAYSDKPSSAGTPPGVDVEERPPAP